LVGKFENIATNNNPPPMASSKMSPVLSLGSDGLSVAEVLWGGAGKRNLDFN
jgi:hypothetical protein